MHLLTINLFISTQKKSMLLQKFVYIVIILLFICEQYCCSRNNSLFLFINLGWNPNLERNNEEDNLSDNTILSMLQNKMIKK